MINSPLIDPESKLKELKDKYSELQKDLRQFEEMNNIPNNNLISQLEPYKRLKHSINSNFDFIKNKIDELNNYLDDETQIYPTKIIKDIKESLKKIDLNKLNNQKEAFQNTAEIIDKKFSKYINSYEENSYTKESSEKKSQEFKMIDIPSNEELLRKRTDELLNIKNISAQVAEISTAMGIEINEQGKKMETIEKYIDKSEDNTKKAYKEALETEIIVNKSKKRLYCLAFFIIILISIIVYLIMKIF